MTDWNEIRNKYITTTTSYRRLAAEYGIDQAIIARRGKDEKWVEARKQYVGEVSARIIENSKEAEVDRAKKIHSVADKLLEKIESIVETVKPDRMCAKDIRALTAAVKDLKDIQGVRSDLDEKEQMARIANLQSVADGDSGKAREKLEVIGLPEEFKA